MSSSRLRIPRFAETVDERGEIGQGGGEIGIHLHVATRRTVPVIRRRAIAQDPLVQLQPGMCKRCGICTLRAWISSDSIDVACNRSFKALCCSLAVSAVATSTGNCPFFMSSLSCSNVRSKSVICQMSFSNSCKAPIGEEVGQRRSHAPDASPTTRHGRSRRVRRSRRAIVVDR